MLIPLLVCSDNVFAYFVSELGPFFEHFEKERVKSFRAFDCFRERIEFSGDKVPTPEQVAEMHHLAHKECFIANSVLTDVVVAGIPSH